MRQAETERVKCVALQRHGLRPAEIAETILLAMPCLASAYALHHTTVAGSDTLSVEAICLVVGVAVAGFLGCSARLDARLGHDKTIYRSTAGHGITIGITLVPLTASLITLLIARPDWEQASYWESVNSGRVVYNIHVDILAASRYDLRDAITCWYVAESHINFRRKYFHAIALLLFVPGYILEPELMHLSFSVAMGMLIYIEYVRIYHVGPVLTETMDRFVHQFMDARDQSVTLAIDDSRKGGINRVVVISHLSLLIGCAVPVWLVSIISSIDSIPYVLGLAGVLSLGVGDSLASIVGKSYGRTRWYMRGKTVEGTIGFVTGLWSAMYIVHLYVDSSGYSHDSISSRSMVVAAVFTGLLEAFSEQNDNLVVPLYLFSVLSLTLVWKL
ncbi:hypothetical protein BASA81_010874 [Batrachochytrium salamandrivorans]|nr:hypothetical protein BASA81_010874 [Batrachochytrium salamandrivorans]